jgi:MFS family permease
MLSNRWLILAVLFFARLTMAFQFQSIAALSPLIIDDFGLDLADIGFLIGLYFAPGVIFALPGGAIAARFGDKQIVSIGMILMLVGGAMIALTETWNILVAGRLVAGAGGVVLNVVMTKMLVDWFAGREISTAMAIFVNSWPVGIALALLVLPIFATFGGLTFTWWALWALIVAGLVLFATLYHAPPDASGGPVTLNRAGFPVLALVCASLVWALYNMALAMVFSFGPALFVQQGWDLQEAGSVTGLFMILFSVALPIGGIVADRTGRKDMVILVSLVSFAVLIPMMLYLPAAALAIFCTVAVLFALCAGPVMTLPAEVLPNEARAFGMGVFFSIYYGLMMIGPRIGGGLAEAAGDAGMAMIAGAVMSLAAVVSLGVFRWVSRR